MSALKFVFVIPSIINYFLRCAMVLQRYYVHAVQLTCVYVRTTGVLLCNFNGFITTLKMTPSDVR